LPQSASCSESSVKKQHDPGQTLRQFYRSFRAIFRGLHGNLAFPFAFLNRLNFQGGDNGTRNFAVAFGCAYSGNPFVMVVLRSLTSGDWISRINKAPPNGGALFFRR
jgi:hypothetical protein